MKRKILLSLLSLFVAFSAFSQTSVSGNVVTDVTWTKANSPYIISDFIRVFENATLTIEPGVVVIREKGNWIIINGGSLKADGSLDDPIVFEDRYEGPSSNDNFFILYNQSNLDNSSISNVNVVSKSGGFLFSKFFISFRPTDPGPNSKTITGSLTISQSSFLDMSLDIGGASMASIILDDVILNDCYVTTNGADLAANEIRNSTIINSLIYDPAYDTELKLINNIITDSRIQMGEGIGIHILDSKVYNSSIYGRGNGPLRMTNSKFVNTVASVPTSKVVVDRSIFAALRDDLEMIDGFDRVPATALIRASEISLNNSQFIGNGVYSAIELTKELYFNPEEADNDILNNSFSNFNIGIDVKYDFIHSSLKISNNNFKNIVQAFIKNLNTRDINAQFNYFEGITDLDELEDKILHRVDNLAPGLVDFSNPLSVPEALVIPTPPEVVMTRKFSDNDYTDKVEISFTQLDADTDKIKVYSFTSDDFSDLITLAEVSTPLSTVELDYQPDQKYAVTALDPNGSESWFSTAINEVPQLTPQISNATVNEDESGRLTFQVVSEEAELIRLVAKTTASTSLIKPENLIINKLNVDQNTRSYELILTPEPDAFGAIDVQVTIEDGLNSFNANLGTLTVLPVNDHKPVMLTENINVGELDEDYGLSINDANFYSKISATDEDGDPIRYVVSEILNGTINRGDAELKVGDTLRSLAYNVWYAPPNESGAIEAFKVKASDGEFNSDTDLTVSFNVRPSNDPPGFDTPNFFVLERRAEQKVMEVKNLSPGPLEDEDLTLTLSPNRIYPFPTSSLTIDLSEDQKSAKITLDYIPEEQGFYYLDLVLSDGTNQVMVRLNMVFYEPNTSPEVFENSLSQVYSNETYSYHPEVQDSEAFWVDNVSVPEFIDYDSALFIANYLGSGVSGDLDGVRHTVRTQGVRGMVFDDSGNLYTAEPANGKIRKTDKNGAVVTFAGSGSRVNSAGFALDVGFEDVWAMEFDKEGNFYVADYNGDRVMKVSPEGMVEPFLGINDRSWHTNGERINAGINAPVDILFDSDGNMYVLSNSLIKKIDTNDFVSEYVNQSTPNVSWVSAEKMSINSRDEIIITDRFSNKLHKVIDGEVTVIELPDPDIRSYGIDYFTDDKVVFADFDAGRIYMYDLLNEELTILAGQGNQEFMDGMIAADSEVNYPYELIVNDGKIYFYDSGDAMVKVLYPSYYNFAIKPGAGDIGTHDISFQVTDIYGLSTDHVDQIEVFKSDKVEASNMSQQISYIEDEVVNFADIVVSGTEPEDIVEASVSLLNPDHGALSTSSGHGESFDPDTGIWFISAGTEIVNDALSKLSFLPRQHLSQDSDLLIILKRKGGVITNEGRISLKVTPVNDILELDPLPVEVAYSEVPYVFEFNIDDPDDYYFEWDVQQMPEWLELNSWVEVTTFSGDPNRGYVSNGTRQEASYRSPRHVAVGSSGTVYIAENNLVRKISPEGVVSILAGSESGGDIDGQGTEARFGTITSMVVDSDDNVYVYDFHARKIKRINIEGLVESLVGNGDFGNEDGSWLGASFSYLIDLTLDRDGNIYGISYYDGAIRKVSTNGTVETIIGSNLTGKHEGPFDQFGPGQDLYSLALDSEGNLIIGGSGYIYKADFSTETVSVLIGNGERTSKNGPLAEARVTTVYDLITDKYDNIYFTEGSALKVVKGDQVITLAGNTSVSGYSNGSDSEAMFNEVTGIADGRNGELLIADFNNHAIRSIELQNISIKGTPLKTDIGAHPIVIQFFESKEQTYLLDTKIEVESSGMPVINGLNQVFTGVEDDSEIDITGISISEADADSIQVEFELSDPLAGSFPSDAVLGASFDETQGRWSVRSTQASANTLLSDLQFVPGSDFAGAVEVKVTAKRLNGIFTREGSFQIQLSPVNDLPILNLDKVEIMVDLSLDLPIEIIDADMDPVNLMVEGLPNGVLLESDIEFSASTIADLQYGNAADMSDGHISEAVVYNPNKFTMDSIGNYYMIDLNTIRKLERDTVKTLIDFSQNDPQIYAIRGITHDGVDLFVFDYARLFRLDGTEFTLIAGDALGQRGDREGDALSARFDNIKSIVPDGNGGFYIADSGNRKIKYLKDGQVSTFAGNGDYGVIGTPNGAPLETAFASLDQLWLNKSGDVLVMEQDARRIRKITNGMVETVLPKSIDEYLPEFSHFSQDAFDNTFTFQRQAIFVFGKDGAQWKMLTVPSNLADGPEGQFGWSNLTDVHRLSNGSFVLWDNQFRDLRELSYQYKYRLVGTPLPGSEGSTTLTFKLNDGVGGEVSIEVPLTVVEPDRPEVFGLPQDINYIEGDETVNLNPIVLSTDDNEELFEVSLTLSDHGQGSLNSSEVSLEDAYINGAYLLEGDKDFLNEILASLSFLPEKENDKNGSIDFSARRKSGQLAYAGTISLNVTAVNDLPIIETFSEAVLYSGDSLSHSVNVFDVEDGNTLNLVVSDIPDWVTKQVITGRDELIAGKPGEQGLKDGPGENALFTNPAFLTIDNNGDLLISSYGSHTLARIDQEGIVSRVASEGKAGFENGEALKAKFNSPEGIAVDQEGNIYLADRLNRVIRKISVDGSVSTIAGSGDQGQLDGTGGEASFISPHSLVFSNDKQTLFIGDQFGIRKLDINTMQVSTLLLNYSVVRGYASDMRLLITKNDRLLVTAQNQIVVFNMSGQAIALYGSGYGGYLDGYVSSARFARITGIAEDEEGNIYILDSGNSLIRKLDMSSLLVSTIAGNQGAEGYSSGINTGIQLNAWGNLIYHDGALLFADTRNHVVRKLHLNELALTGKPAREDVGEYDLRLSVQDSQNGVTSRDLKIIVLEGDKPAVKGLDTLLIVSEESDQAILPKIELLTEPGELIEIELSLEGDLIAAVGRDQQNTWSFDETHAKWTFEGTTEQVNEELGELKIFSESFSDANLNFEFRQQGGNLSFTGTICLIANPVNDSPVLISDNVYEVMVGETFEFDFDVTDEDSEVFSITSVDFPEWMITDSVWIIQPFVESIYSEKLPQPYKDSLNIRAYDLAVNSHGELFMASARRNMIIQILPDGTMVPYAGTGSGGYLDGDKSTAEFNFPSSIAFDSMDNLFISDQYNNRVRMIDKEGVVSTVAGTGQYGRQDGPGNEATLASPYNIRFDSEGNLIIAGRDQIAKMDASYNVSALVGKLGEYADIDGDVAEARLGLPYSVVPMSDGSLVISDYAFGKVKKLDQGELSTISGSGIRAYDDKNLLESSFQSVSSMIELGSGQILVTDNENHAVRLLDIDKDMVTTVAGKGYYGNDFGLALNSALAKPNSMVQLPNGDILIAEFGTGRIKRIAMHVPEISGTPSESQIGEHKFTIRISDGKDGIIEKEITINVIPANTAPTVTIIADITETYAVDGTISVPLFDHFSDAEDADSELTYEVVSNTDNTVVTSEAVDSADGILTLNVQNAGTTQLEVKATDSRGASVSTSFAVTVEQAVATISITNTEFVNDGEEKTVSVTTDPVGLSYTITYDGIDEAPSAIGTYEVLVSLDERNYAGTATAQLSVVNVAPEDLTLSGLTVFENQEAGNTVGTLTVTDQNPVDTHTYSLPAGVTDNDLFAISGTTLSATETFDFETIDEYTVTVKVEDNQGGSYEEAFTITILDVNDTPGASAPAPIEIVKDLGPLSFTVSGLNTGGEAAQTLMLSTTITGVLASASVVDNADGTAVVTFESAIGQEGTGNIELTVKDDGGSANGGVDTYVLDIPVTVSPANLTVAAAGNCGPGQVSLSASGADAYSWYAGALGGEVIGTGAEFIADVTASTTYYVAGTFSGEESPLRASVLASVFDLPEVPVIVNNAEVLSVTEVVGATYAWFRNGTEVADATGATFAPTESGDYTVMITNANGCTAMSDPLSVIITGLEEGVPAIQVTVYPVPASDYIYLSFAEVMRKGTQIRLSDNSGKDLTSFILQVADTQARLDVRAFASGIHFVTVQDGDKLVRKRVMIRK